MNKSLMPLSFLSVVLCATGCQQPAETPAARADKFDAVAAKTADATQEMKDYTFAEKEEFVTKMQARLDSIKVDLDQISKQIEQSSDQVKNEDRPKLLALRQQTTALEVQLQKAKEANESTWDEVKAGFKKGYGELQDGVTSARQWVSEKIAP